ncbi:exonuclease subunit SbcD [Shewanella surugensis]|uniref:Nuclease SbcCD subunit D n=1 Tax=Shewanella surugensis TaxID=212020 RepID=A0ABT0LGB4_9GAMM|nr:exonuclease subunit SbcD [Shewanella surugensis]MCL1126525.1 exonuclease subunit SbcD [Shewanella surugensis]
MKILHTSDWHLGQSFLTKSRKDEHHAFLDWLLAQVQLHMIDAIIVAGDIFDTGTPPSYAREMYNRFVVAINQLGCTLVVLGGNHDSVSMLNESKTLLACLNTHVIANTSDEIDEQVFALKNRQGEVGAVLCAVPFIRARDVVVSVAGETGVEKRQVLGEAIKRHYTQIYEAALTLRKDNGWDVPIIATGHLTALGVSQSESVRDIYIGSLEGFAADGFPPADYIALGHIHRPQIVAKSEHIRYSGSPIPLSFDELKYTKQVVVVEFEKAKRLSITPIEIPIFQPMAVLKGSLDDIAAQLASFDVEPIGLPTWLFIEVHMQDYFSDLQQRIQNMTQDLHVEVLRLKRARGQSQAALEQVAKETLAELTPFDVFDKRLTLESMKEEIEAGQLDRIKTQFQQIVSEIELQELSE